MWAVIRRPHRFESISPILNLYQITIVAGH
jgi:hypothetical protein